MTVDDYFDTVAEGILALSRFIVVVPLAILLFPFWVVGWVVERTSR